MGKRISQLTELTAPQSADYIPVVDTSDTTDSSAGTTKRLTLSSMIDLVPLVELTALVSETLNVFVVDLAYTDTNALVFTLPADAIAMFALVIVDTVWDVAPDLTVGTAGDADALVKNHEHTLDDTDPSFVAHPYHATANTAFYTTWNQNGASQGAGELIVFYYQR